MIKTTLFILTLSSSIYTPQINARNQLAALTGGMVMGAGILYMQAKTYELSKILRGDRQFHTRPFEEKKKAMMPILKGLGVTIAGLGILAYGMK